MPKGELPDARKAHAAAEAALQEARTSLNTGAYLEARDAARALTAEINKQLLALDAAAAPKTTKPGRRRR